MSRKELFRRYTLFLCSVFVNAFGISVITKAMLGTSAIPLYALYDGAIHHLHERPFHIVGNDHDKKGRNQNKTLRIGHSNPGRIVLRIIHRCFHALFACVVISRLLYSQDSDPICRLLHLRIGHQPGSQGGCRDGCRRIFGSGHCQVCPQGVRLCQSMFRCLAGFDCLRLVSNISFRYRGSA